MHSPPIVSIFGSSKPKRGDEEYKLAYTTGELLARAGFTICNGGYGGTMEAAAEGAKAGGGTTIGVVSSFFSIVANRFIDKKIITDQVTDRLLKLIELGNAYVVLKGSTGTLLEFAAVWELINKGVIGTKPIILIGKFWQPLVRILQDELIVEGTKQASALVTIVSSPKECVELLIKQFISH
jgi:uncharacterized protein (TIGR00725 family)